MFDGQTSIYINICISMFVIRSEEKSKRKHETELLFVGIESMYLMGEYNSNKEEANKGIS